MAIKPFFQGRLIAIGGNEDRAEDLVVLKRVVQEVGKTDYKVGVITTASREPEQRGKDYYKVFTALGSSGIEILKIKTWLPANEHTFAKKLDDVDYQVLSCELPLVVKERCQIIQIWFIHKVSRINCRRSLRLICFTTSRPYLEYIRYS